MIENNWIRYERPNDRLRDRAQSVTRGEFERVTSAKYDGKTLALLLEAGEITQEQYERLRRER